MPARHPLRWLAGAAMARLDAGWVPPPVVADLEVAEGGLAPERWVALLRELPQLWALRLRGPDPLGWTPLPEVMGVAPATADVVVYAPVPRPERIGPTLAAHPRAEVRLVVTPENLEEVRRTVAAVDSARISLHVELTQATLPVWRELRRGPTPVHLGLPAPSLPPEQAREPLPPAAHALREALLTPRRGGPRGLVAWPAWWAWSRAVAGALAPEVRPFPCRQLRDLLTVRADGSVVRCLADGDRMVSLAGYDLPEAWYGSRATAFRARVDACPGCRQVGVRAASALLRGAP